MRDTLDDTFGVDTGADPELRTPLAFADLEHPDEPRTSFYRQPKAPDMNITSAEVDKEVVTAVPVLWFTTSCLSDDPSRTTIHDLLTWRARRTHTVIDLDWRPQFWPDPATATAELDQVLDQVTMAIGNRAECEVAVGESDPDRAADALLARGLDAAIVKMGSDGVLVATADGTRERVAPSRSRWCVAWEQGMLSAARSAHGLLSGWDLVRCARAGNAAGAIVASRLMCADDMPFVEEINDVLDG